MNIELNASIFIGCVISGILCIIFVGLASNIAKIRRFMIPGRDESSHFYFLAYNGYTEEAKRALLVFIWRSKTMERFVNATTKEESEQCYERLKALHWKMFALIGEEFPEYKKIRERFKT